MLQKALAPLTFFQRLLIALPLDMTQHVLRDPVDVPERELAKQLVSTGRDMDVSTAKSANGTVHV